MKFMKIPLIVMLAVALVACSPAPTQSPNATFTSVPTSTPTLAPTPTETPTPMPTKDPNAPDEYTRFENGVYYLDLKTEKGNTLTYTWDQERNTWERMLFSGYLEDYSTEINENGMHQPDQLLTAIYIDKSIEGEVSLPTLTHADNTDPLGTINFSTNINTDILNSLINRGIISGVTDFNFAKWNEGKFYLEFANADGPQRWDLRSTISVHIRGDHDELQQNMATNGFTEAKSSSSYGPANSYMVKISSENGNLIVDIAPSLRPATRWTEKQMLEMIFFGPANVMAHEDLTQPGSGSLLSEYVLNSKTLPYFTFGPPP